MFRSYNYKRYDFLSIILMFLLITISYFVIGSATRINSIEGTDYYAQRQLMGFSIGLVLMLLVSFFDYHLLGKLAIPIYLLNVGLLVAVLMFGKEVNGAVRWIEMLGMTIQPSEFSKFFMVIVLAKYFDRFQKHINSVFVWLGAGILIVIPMMLIRKQPDLSTALVLVFLLGIMLFAAGIKYRYIFILLGIAIVMMFGVLWYIQQPDQVLLSDNQLGRIMAMINPEEYELSIALQTQNSVQGIGSGQLFGKGIYNGKLNQYNYLPESQTDFIFSIIGEEFGFIGCSVVLLLMLALMLRVLYIAKDSKDLMGQLLCAGFVAVLGFQTFINVGVTTNIVPNTGLPLPFISYGLSALWSNMLMLGLVLNLSIQRKTNK
ncbi:rod shape-determining protein RodA [Vallitaleaceae bacterium 9-2]